MRRDKQLDRLLAQLDSPTGDVRATLEHLQRRLACVVWRPRRMRVSKRQRNQIFERLRLLLAHPEVAVRFEVAYGLSRWWELRAASALVRVLEDRTEAPRVRGQAAEGLGMILAGARIPTARAVSALRAGLHDPDVEVRFWCVYAVGRLEVHDACTELEALARRDDAVCPGMSTVASEAAAALVYLRT